MTDDRCTIADFRLPIADCSPMIPIANHQS